METEQPGTRSHGKHRRDRAARDRAPGERAEGKEGPRTSTREREKEAEGWWGRVRGGELGERVGRGDV